jgi:exopolysaccharide biosynthesis polyprenyl glycosylphosphotransferase
LFFCWQLSRLPTLGAAMFAVVTSLTLLLVALLNFCSAIAVAALSRRFNRPREAIVVGTGRRAELLKINLLAQASRINIYGAIDDEFLGADSARNDYLGPIGSLAELLKAHPVELVLIGLPMRSKYDEIQRVIEICETVGVESHYMQDIFETGRLRAQVHPEMPHDFQVLTTLKRTPRWFIKRLFDIFGAGVLLVILAPVLLGAALAVRLSGPGPIFFVQPRYGRHRKRFPMFKFRSMVNDAELKQAELEVHNEAQGPVFKLKQDPRVTRVGVFLRKTSIDELPQLFNVLRGEMSLVGPRPLPLRDVSRFDEPWLLRRFSVRPGMTCIWQISGRSNTTFDDWMKQDLTYIDNWSLSLDLSILVRTIPAVLRGTGAA